MANGRPGILSAGAVALVQAGLDRAEAGFGELLGLPLAIQLELLSLEAPDVVAARAGRPEEPVTGIYVAYDGDLSGHCLLYLNDASVQQLARRLLGDQATPALTESALLEVGNITVSGLVNGLADSGGWRIQVSPPTLARDMLGALVGSILAAASLASRELLAVRASFRAGGEAVRGTVLLMPDAASLYKLLGANSA